MIDEVHLLNEDRGATLEAIVSRLKTIRQAQSLSNAPSSELRLVSVSATIPNIQGYWCHHVALGSLITITIISDLADWLQVPPAGLKWFVPTLLRTLFICTSSFGEEFRPVKLELHVHGYPENSSSSSVLFENSLNYKIFDLINRYSSGRPTLVVWLSFSISLWAFSYLSWCQ